MTSRCDVSFKQEPLPHFEDKVWDVLAITILKNAP